MYGGHQTVNSGVFAVSGTSDAIVDWVIVELRSNTDNTKVVANTAALIQRDGDIVDIDGVSDVTIPGVAAGSYYVVVNHRNHLGVMTSAPVALSPTSTTPINFTSPGLGTYGTSGQRLVETGAMALWGGDANNNNRVSYASGTATDQDAILMRVGPESPSAIIT